MRITGRRLQVQEEHIPLIITGDIVVTGGSPVQFFDGVNFVPNREGVPASPIMLEHNISVSEMDGATVGTSSTTYFYENDNLILASNSAYELDGNSLIVKKNVTPGEAITIKAVTEFIGIISSQVYRREDSLVLRTITKTESFYDVYLSTPKVEKFDAYRNPNKQKNITANIKQGQYDVTNLSGLTIKWLNSNAEDVMVNELYAESISANRLTLTIDRSYINKEVITCEVWKGGSMVARTSTTMVRVFNNFRTEVRVPELPIKSTTKYLTCQLLLNDMTGEIDVDSAFSVKWIANEWGKDKEIGSTSNAKVPLRTLDLRDKELSIDVDLKRIECYGAITDTVMYTDKNGNVLTTLILGK